MGVFIEMRFILVIFLFSPLIAKFINYLGVENIYPNFTTTLMFIAGVMGLAICESIEGKKEED